MTLPIPTIRALDTKESETALPALAAILVDAIDSGASVNFVAGFSQADAERFWRGQLGAVADGMRHILIAESAGRIVGTVVVSFAPQPNQPHRADIGKMLVHSGVRRRGIGQRLLAAA